MQSKYDFKQMVFSLDCYKGNVADMWADISDFIRILINDGYLCKVYDDSGTDIIIVEFDFIDEGISDGELRWCTWDECEVLEHLAEQESDESVNVNITIEK